MSDEQITAGTNEGGIDPKAVWDLIMAEGWRRIDDDTFNTMLSRIVENTVVFTQQSEVTHFDTTVLVVGGDPADTSALVETGFAPTFEGNEEAMHAAMEATGRGAAEQGVLPYAVFVIIESVQGHKREEQREVLVTSGATVDSRRAMALQPILRTDDGLVRVQAPELLHESGDEQVPWDDLIDDFYRGYFTARLGGTGAGGAGTTDAEPGDSKAAADAAPDETEGA